MIKTLLQQVKEYKAASLLTPLFTGLEVLMEVLIPFVTASIIDKGIEAVEPDHIRDVKVRMTICGGRIVYQG